MDNVTWVIMVTFLMALAVIVSAGTKSDLDNVQVNKSDVREWAENKMSITNELYKYKLRHDSDVISDYELFNEGGEVV